MELRVLELGVLELGVLELGVMELGVMVLEGVLERYGIVFEEISSWKPLTMYLGMKTTF